MATDTHTVLVTIYRQAHIIMPSLHMQVIPPPLEPSVVADPSVALFVRSVPRVRDTLRLAVSFRIGSCRWRCDWGVGACKSMHPWTKCR